jgi:membrane-associated phospholipid phosphatase
VTPDRKYYLRVALLAYGIWIVAFEAVGRFASTLPTHDPTTGLDDMIPLVPEFIWFYEVCYLFPFLPLLVLKDFHRLNVLLLSIILANALAFIVYVAYPVALPRPELGNSLAERVLSIEHAAGFQPGANKLPSLHVAFAWHVALACHGQRLGRVLEAVIFVVAGMITLSVLFLKQHIIVDALTGILLAFGTWWLATQLYPLMIDPKAQPRAALKHMLRRTATVIWRLALAAALLGSLWLLARGEQRLLGVTRMRWEL